MTTLVQRDDASAELPPTAAAPARLADPRRAGLPVGVADHPRATPRADAEIAAEIQDYLSRGLQVEGSAVDVQVTDGVVELTGELARQMYVHRLIERVNGIDGVVSVTSRLTARYNDAVVPFAWGFPV